LSVEIFDFSVSALLRLHHVSFMPSDNPIIIGNIGHSESLLSIVTKEDILAQHHIDWGTQSLVEKLLVNFEYLGADDQARILLKKYGLYHEDREKFEKRLDPFDTAEMNSMLNVIYQIVTPHIEELIHECHQIIAYVRSEVPNPNFEAVYMYGLANMVANLDGYIEKRLQLPTTLVNPIADKVFQNEGIPTDVAEGSDFALALGLAIRKVGWP
jgi:Tfp pilus assembly PilM family ATPase